MAFLAERQLPGLDRDALLRSLKSLDQAAQAMREARIAVWHLGSAIVLEREACARQVDAASATAVADADDRVGVSSDRITHGVAVTRGRRKPRRRHQP